MTLFLVLAAGALLLVGIAKAVNRQRPEPDPWRDGDTVALDGQYVRDPRLDDPAERLRDTLLDDGYPTAEVDLIVARYEEWLNRARDAS